MDIDVLVLHAETHDEFADLLCEALAERGISMVSGAPGYDMVGARVVVPLAPIAPECIAEAITRGIAVLPATADGGWLAGPGEDRARRVADAVDALLVIGRSAERTSIDSVMRAGIDIATCLESPAETSELERICEALSLAIQWGGPVYNRGGIETCARIYGSAAEAVRQYIDARVAEGRGHLLDAIAYELEEVERVLAETGPQAWDERAWTLRHTFDRILTARRTADALKAIDDLFSGLVRAGRQPNASLVYDIISVSISHAAPIYNSGSAVGCAQIYLCTAAGLLRLLGAEPQGPEGRTEPLAREILIPLVASGARQFESDADGLAWTLRRAFDRLVETAAEERSWEHDS